MNIGVWMCIVLVPGFTIIGILFGIFKEKAAKFVSGFDSLSKEEQDLYDRAYIARDIRNSCLLWAFIMMIGATASFFLSGYFAILAYVIWAVLFFKDVHIDAHKAFEKYLRK